MFFFNFVFSFITEEVEEMLVNMICKQLGILTEDGEGFANVMYKACAYIVTSQSTPQLLLHLMCWVPAKIFTKQSIQVTYCHLNKLANEHSKWGPPNGVRRFPFCEGIETS